MPHTNEKPVALSFYASPDFRDKLKQISTDNHRSMSAEIISRLEKTIIEDEAKKKR